MTTETVRPVGTDLKVARVRAGIKAMNVAEAMGISPSRLSRIEGPEPVTERMAGRYLIALEKCRTSGGKAA